MRALGEWENFYVIVGSSVGALIGLQFVVLILVAENPLARSEALGRTFGTPTIIHFSPVLLLSAIVSAPWHGIAAVAVLFGLVGLSGLTYTVIVARRLRTQTEYKAVFEDWLCCR
jgi:ABC-type Fe3+-siderophore transport system permease subunit